MIDLNVKKIENRVYIPHYVVLSQSKLKRMNVINSPAPSILTVCCGCAPSTSSTISVPVVVGHTRGSNGGARTRSNNGGASSSRLVGSGGGGGWAAGSGG